VIINSNPAAFQNLPPALAKQAKRSETDATNGADTTQLTSTAEQMSVSGENFTEVDSPLQDVDAANASTELARMSILGQPAAAMLAQANLTPQSALQLLQE
jgi:flagellin